MTMSPKGFLVSPANRPADLPVKSTASPLIIESGEQAAIGAANESPQQTREQPADQGAHTTAGNLAELRISGQLDAWRSTLSASAASLSVRALMLLAGLCLLSSPRPASAKIQHFYGRAPISWSSSIPGINKHDVFYFDLSIEDSIQDSIDNVIPNAFGGVTAIGDFFNSIVGFRMHAYPGNTGGFDPSGTTFLPGNIRTIDGGPGPGNSNFLEKIELSMKVSAASLASGTPFSYVYINLYNGSLYINPSTTQLLLDYSAGYPMTFAELFLQGPSTMEDFRSERDAEATALVDGIFLEGLVGSGTLASGQGVTVDYVPAPVPAPLPFLGAGAAFGWSRRLRRRIRGKAS